MMAQVPPRWQAYIGGHEFDLDFLQSAFLHAEGGGGGDPSVAADSDGTYFQSPRLDLFPELGDEGHRMGEQILRDPGNAAVEIAEAPWPVQQLAEDERRPALGEDLGTQGNGAELSIAGHVPKLDSSRAPGKFNF